MKTALLRNVLFSCVVLSLTACSAPAPAPVDASASAEVSTTSNASESSSSEASSKANQGSGYTVLSCGEELKFEKAPERVVLLNDIGVPFLAGLGELSKVVAMSQQPSKEIYEESVYTELAKVPILEGTVRSGGGSVVAVEKIMEVDPDLIIGTSATTDFEKLKGAGVQVYTPNQYCKNAKAKPASFEDMAEETLNIAKLLNVSEKAEALNKELYAKIEAVRAQSPKSRGTGMAIYIDEGTEEFWGYGNGSMVQPLFEAVGLENVYKDVPERLIEGMSMESVLDKNPQTIVLLYLHGTPESVINTFKAIPGAMELEAIKNNKIYAMPFRLTDPPSPVSVTGVEKLNELLGK